MRQSRREVEGILCLKDQSNCAQNRRCHSPIFAPTSPSSPCYIDFDHAWRGLDMARVQWGTAAYKAADDFRESQAEPFASLAERQCLDR